MSGIGSAISGTAKATTAVVGAGVMAFAGLSKAALDSCASLEQNIGGIETLFGAGGKSIEEYADNVGKSIDEVKDEYDSLIRAQETMLANADKAYLDAGMSSNTYMETVTGFSAALIQSLNGDTEAAADKANQAIIDMSDNANKMGSDITSIQNAYQGFAKQNYTMLDNLKLGYGGTKEEMQRLLEDAQAFSGIQYDISSYADVVDAIHVIQTELGITGTTAAEAAGTLEGSMAAAKAAYENFLAGTGSAEQLADTIAVAAGNIANNLIEIVPRLADGVTEVIEGLAPQIGPLVESLLPAFVTGAISLTEGLVSALPGVLSALSAVIPDIITAIAQSMPLLLAAGVQILQMLLSGIQQNLPLIMESTSEMMTQLLLSLTSMLPQLLQMGLQIIIQLAQGISQALPTLLPTITEILLQICMMLIENIPLLVEVAVQLIVGLAEGLIAALPVLIEMVPDIIMAIVDALIASAPLILDANEALQSMMEELLQKAWDSISAFCAETLPGLMEDIGRWFSELPNKIAYWLGFAIGKVASWASDMHGKAVDAASGFVAKAVECVKNLPENMAEWLNKVINEKIPEFKNSLIETMQELPEKILEIGSDIVTYLWDGISGGWDWLTGKVGELTDSLIGGIKDGFGLSGKKSDTSNQTSVAGFEDAESFVNANGTVQHINVGADALSAGVGVGSGVQFESVTKVYLEGDSEGIFHVVRTENEVFRKSTGENAW